MDNFAFVVGFDLGHGETALTMVNLKSEHKKEPAVKIKVKGESNFITAIAYHPKKGILIGEPAITTEGVTESHLAFKQRPNSDSTYQKILTDFVSHIFQEVKAASYGITDENTLFVIGCPTDWATEKNRHLVSTYETIFHNKAKIPHVKVVAESRGALMNAIESGDINMAELRGRALVIDLGSSTADFTLINLAQRHADPFDFGHDLGASLIDKVIFQHLLYQHKRRNDLIPILTSSSVLRSRCELACRKAKESWFKNPDGTARIDVDIITDELEFRGRVTTQLMHEVLGATFAGLRDMETVYGKSFAYLPKKSWEEELKAQLTQAKNASEKIGKLPDIVLLTGGASQMSFVEPVCKSVFPKSKILRGPEPEYAISRGLTYWGRVDVRTQGFSRAIDKFVEENIRPEVTKNVGALYGAVADRIANGVTRVIKNEFDGWKSQRYTTINGMKSGIEREVSRWVDSQLNKEVGGCIAESVVKISKTLVEQVKSLEQQYDIPIGTLGMSFDADGLGKIDLRIDVPHDHDYTDGVGEALANIVGVVAGIMVGFVTLSVVPIVLSIVCGIIVTISTTLGTLLAGILLSNPVGWAFLGIGIVSLWAGTGIADTIKEELPGWDLPGLVRVMIGTDSIHQKIDSRRSEISTKVAATLSQDSDLRNKIIDTMTETFKKQLKVKADDARVLIS
jgi:hypothetical protein